MSYIIQYIRESQAKYPHTDRTPIGVLVHLFYINGNGIEFIDGNPIREVEFNRIVPFIEYYKDQMKYAEIVKYLNEYDTEEVTSIYDNLKNVNDITKGLVKEHPNMEKLLKSDDELYDEAMKRFVSRHDKVISVDNYTLGDLKDTDVLKKLIALNKYDIDLNHRGSYKISCLNSNTDVDLLEVAIALSKAYLETTEDKDTIETLGSNVTRLESILDKKER